MPWNSDQSVYTERYRTPTIRRPFPKTVGPESWTSMSAYQEYRVRAYVKHSNPPQILTLDPGQSGLYHHADYDLTSQLHLKTRLGIKDMKVNLAQSLAEYRKTCSMVVDLAKGIVDTFRYLRKGRLDGFNKLLNPKSSAFDKALASKWLEYQYGWKPLVSDIYGSMQTLSDRMLYPKPYPVTQTFKVKRTGEASQAFVDFSDNLGNPIKAKLSCAYSVHSRLKVSYDVTPTSLPFMAKNFGLTNPALLAWELVPYSFVFDLIVPVGDILNGLDAMIGIGSFKGLQSETRRADFKISGSGSSHSLLRAYDRWQTGNLRFGVPTYSPSTSMTAVANGIALLKQLRK